MGKADGSHLLRVLGVAFGIAAVIGGTIGQGILRSPGLVAGGVPNGRLIILLWILGGAVAMIDAMSTVELAASIRRTGGPYSFVTRAFGRFPGLLTGMADWLGYAGAAAFVAVVFGEYLHRLGIATGVPIGLLAVALIALAGGVQALGTRIGGASQEIGSAVKALIFVALIAGLLIAPRGAPAPAVLTATPLTFAGLIVAVRSIIGTYLGWNQAAYYGEEVVDPRRTIVRATFTGIALVTAIYVAVNLALLAVLSPQEMAGSTLVAADAAGRVFGPSADMIVTAVSLISLVTILNLFLMTLPRLLFAMARDAGIPRLSHVSRNGSPQYAIALMAVVAALLATIGVYTILLAFSVWLITAVAVSVNLAAIVLRRREPDLERPYRMPFFPLPAIFALLVNLSFLAAFLYESPLTAVQASVLALVMAGLVVLSTRPAASA
jgi:APA family basic amino acid/polyamine antiporter